jgi:hypothetical protein
MQNSNVTAIAEMKLASENLAESKLAIPESG